MKRVVIYLMVLLFITPEVTQAKIWRVNGDGGADFNNLNAAFAAYAAGDTIHLEPFLAFII